MFSNKKVLNYKVVDLLKYKLVVSCCSSHVPSSTATIADVLVTTGGSSTISIDNLSSTSGTGFGGTEVATFFTSCF